VHTAANGTEAMKLIEEQTFDLLLLDINMPGPNGIQALQAVRRGMGLPVLILSGRGRERDKAEALDLGADDYLTKPFGIGELVARIKALLRRGRPGPRETVPTYGYGGLKLDFAAYVWNFVQEIRPKIVPDRARPRYLLTEPYVGYRMPAHEAAASV
jgi:two-component system KDP operon response regulator KdpE